MNYGVFQSLLYTMFRTIVSEISNLRAMASVLPVALCNSRMRVTFDGVSLCRRFGLGVARRLCAEWALFSCCVFHSKLKARLSFFVSFLWLTVGRKGSGAKNSLATILCTVIVFPLMLTRRYPFWLVRDLRMRPVAMRLIRPRSLTAYRSSAVTSFQFSIVTPGGRESISYHKRGG